MSQQSVSTHSSSEQENTMPELVTASASRKIGIKLLDRKQIESSLPDFNEIMKVIDRQRNLAELHDRSDHKFKNAQFHLMHDNILGIFGGRGSGKTSILFSLREILFSRSSQHNKNNPADIILPIISPELISENCSMLSWVLAMFGDVVNEIDHRLRQHPDLQKEIFEQYSRLHIENCNTRFQASFLQQEYNGLLRECGSIRVFREMYRYEYEEMVNLQAQHSQRQYQLMDRLNRFWSLLSTIQRKLNPHSNAFPLIFIMFDDIDLAPERSVELLMSAYKYFSSPHIVIFLTAAQRTLRQVLTYRMYEKVVGSEYTSLIQGNDIQGFRQELWRDSYRIDRASEAATEYLNKVIPQSSRHDLVRFETYDKKLLFRYSKEFAVDQYAFEQDQSIPLNQFVCGCIQEHLLKQGEPNFVETSKNKMAREYYLLFGDKSRYISNACLGILDACEQMEELRSNPPKGEKYVQSLYYILRHLLTVLITSHTRNLEDSSAWIPELLKYKYGDHYLFINYDFLIRRYREAVHEISEAVGRELAVCRQAIPEQDYWLRFQDRVKEYKMSLHKKISALFMMLVFIEHLTAILAPEFYEALGQGRRTRKIHGLNPLLDFLNGDIADELIPSGAMLFPVVPSMDEALHLYGELLENFEYENFSIENAEQVFAYSFYLSQHTELECMLSPASDQQYNLFYTYKHNPHWLRTICSMLYATQSGIQLLNQGFFSHFLTAFQNISILPGLESCISVLETEIKSYAGNWDFCAAAVTLLEELAQTTEAESSINDNCEEAEIPWTQYCATQLEQMDTPKKQSVLYYFCELHQITGSSPKRATEQVQIIIKEVEEILRDCLNELNKLPLSIHIDRSNITDMQMIISNICEAFPEIEEMGQSLLMKATEYQNNYGDSDYIMIPFSDLWNYMRGAHQLIQAEAARSKEEGRENFSIPYYRSLLAELAEIISPYFMKKDKDQIDEFLRNLQTLEVLLPYYFSARFLQANYQRYDGLHLDAPGQPDEQNQTNEQDLQDKPRKWQGKSIAAAYYHKLLKTMEDSEHLVLREILLSIRADYSQLRLREIGVLE